MVVFYEDPLFYAIFGGFILFVVFIYTVALRKKYGKLLFPKVSFGWNILITRASGAVSQAQRFERPRKIPFKLIGHDKGRLETDKEGAFYFIRQGQTMGPGLLSPCKTLAVPKDTNIDWGNNTLVIMEVKETERAIIIPPELDNDTLNLPKYISEAERAAIASSAVHVAEMGKLSDPGFLEKHGAALAMLIIVLIFGVYTLNWLSGQTAATKDITQMNANTMTQCTSLATELGRCKAVINMTVGDRYLAPTASGAPAAAGGGGMIPPWLG